MCSQKFIFRKFRCYAITFKDIRSAPNSSIIDGRSPCDWPLEYRFRALP